MNAYVVTNLQNDKKYIGITSRTIERRWAEHLVEARVQQRGSALHAAIRKYGLGAFVIEEAGTVESWAELCAMEALLIAQRGTRAPAGYNLTDGGEGMPGHVHSPETRTKMAARIYSDEAKAKISAGMMGHVLSAETRAKISAANTGKVFSPETKAKMSAAQMGKVLSPEHVAKIAAASRLTRARKKEAA